MLYTFRQAKHYRWIDPQTPRLIRKLMFHTAEVAETLNSAEAVAGYFQITPRPASAHYCVDADSIVQCVLDKDVAFTCPGANHDAIHIEISGRAKQTSADWSDEFSERTLLRVAGLAAVKCQEFEISAGWLTPQDLTDGFSVGLCTHADGTQASLLANAQRKTMSPFYNAKNPARPLTDHYDPGPNFPKDRFLNMILDAIRGA